MTDIQTNDLKEIFDIESQLENEKKQIQDTLQKKISKQHKSLLSEIENLQKQIQETDQELNQLHTQTTIKTDQEFSPKPLQAQIKQHIVDHILPLIGK